MPLDAPVMTAKGFPVEFVMPTGCPGPGELFMNKPVGGGHATPMRALTWQGTSNVSVETVPDPKIQEPTDAIVRMTSTAICGSDLHLYDVLGMYLDQGDILGHEPMGIVEEVGPDVTHIRPGDRVVIPFNISCGSCWMCRRGFFAQCE